MAIVMQPTGNASLDDIPPNLTNPSCIGSPGDLASTDFDAYSNGNFLGTNSSFPLPFEGNVTTSDVQDWCPWDLLVNQPSGPSDNVYTYPDNSVERPEFAPCFSACARYNQDRDCCTGQYNSPSSCPTSDYSKAAKRVCPDAYSYGNISRIPSTEVSFTKTRMLTANTTQLSTTKPPLSSSPLAPVSKSSSAPAAARQTS